MQLGWHYGGVSLRFFAIPGHAIAELGQARSPDAVLEPQLPSDELFVERALAGVKYREGRAKDQVWTALAASDEQMQATGLRTAVFARPPADLPAILKLADQLEGLAHEESGEQVLIWSCGRCSSRYAVPVPLGRPVTIRCERCHNPVELRVETSQGEEPLMDPYRASINTCRRRLASFFRESMARGWPVVVSGRS